MTNIVKFKARGPRAYLREAQEQGIPVRVKREGIDPGWVHGLIAGVSADFVLIAEISDSMRFDGFLAIALGDVSHAEEDPSREFVQKALALNEQTLAVPADFPLDNWAMIARAAAAVAPVISVNMLDEESGEASYIGKLENAGPEVLSLREIDPNARWYPDAGDYEYDDIGSIGFGTSYMHTLFRVAGEPSGPPQEPRLHSTDPKR